MIALLACYVAYYLVVSSWRGFDLHFNLRLRASWIRNVLRIVGMHIELRGEIPRGNYLFICNHRSFFDPLVVLHFIDALPLSKAEVRRYPLIGFGARITGVLFVDRNSLKSRQEARSTVAETIRKGYSVLVFPEGTTVTTDSSGEFKRGTFIEAASQGIGIVPIALEYKDPDDRWKEISLFKQYLNQFKKRKSTCALQFGTPVYSSDPYFLRSTTKSWIDQALFRIQRVWNSK